MLTIGICLRCPASGKSRPIRPTGQNATAIGCSLLRQIPGRCQYARYIDMTLLPISYPNNLLQQSSLFGGFLLLHQPVEPLLDHLLLLFALFLVVLPRLLALLGLLFVFGVLVEQTLSNLRLRLDDEPTLTNYFTLCRVARRWIDPPSQLQLPSGSTHSSSRYA